MARNSNTNRQIVAALEPWFPVLSYAANAAFLEVLRAIPILGIPRKTERASDLHRAFRKHAQIACDEAETVLTMVQEREGLGLDFIRFDMGIAFAIRWVRYPSDGRLNRNDSQRQTDLEGQGYLFSELSDSRKMPVVTLGLELADDYIEANVPRWWLSRMVLIREITDHATEFLGEICRYAPPAAATTRTLVTPPMIKRVESERVVMRRLVKKAMGE